MDDHDRSPTRRAFLRRTAGALVAGPTALGAIPAAAAGVPASLPACSVITRLWPASEPLRVSSLFGSLPMTREMADDCCLPSLAELIGAMEKVKAAGVSGVPAEWPEDDEDEWD